MNKMPTETEMWDYLKSLPVPPIDVLLSGNMMSYYVNHCYKYMCYHANFEKIIESHYMTALREEVCRWSDDINLHPLTDKMIDPLLERIRHLNSTF